MSLLIFSLYGNIIPYMLEKIVTGVVIAVIAGFLKKKLGLGDKTITVYKNQKKSSKILRAIFVLGWLMYWGGLIYGLSWAMTEGFDSPQATIGLALWFLGLFILFLKKITGIFKGN